MATEVLYYKGNYNWQAHKTWHFQTAIRPKKEIVTDYITLTTSGLLIIKKGYAWDGATWFPDIDSIFRASLAHDALYQLLRMGLLPQEMRKAADRELIKLCKEDKMWGITRAGVWQAVRLLAAGAARVENANPVLIAP